MKKVGGPGVTMAPDARERLKVLMVTTSFPTENNPASGIFVKRLADALSERVELSVLAPASITPCRLAASYPIHWFWYAPYPWQLLAHQPGGIPVALKTKPILWLLLPFFLSMMFFHIIHYGRRVDVIHANWSVPGVIAGLAAWFMRKPAVTTLRGSDVSSMEKSVIKRLMLGVLLRLNKSVLSVSNSMRVELGILMPRYTNKIKTIPNGVDAGLLRIKHDTRPVFRLLTVGNLIPGKDVATIIRALSHQAKHVSLRVVGDGGEGETLKALVQELGLQQRVNFVGAVNPSAISGELEQADAFVLASHAEGRPNVVLEAMAAGCAIISTNLPGVKELIEDQKQGLLFEPGDVSMLASRIGQLVNSPSLCIRLGANARKQIIDAKLTWQHCAVRYASEYSAVLNQSGKHA